MVSFFCAHHEPPDTNNPPTMHTLVEKKNEKKNAHTFESNNNNKQLSRIFLVFLALADISCERCITSYQTVMCAREYRKLQNTTPTSPSPINKRKTIYLRNCISHTYTPSHCFLSQKVFNLRFFLHTTYIRKIVLICSTFKL